MGQPTTNKNVNIFIKTENKPCVDSMDIQIKTSQNENSKTWLRSRHKPDRDPQRVIIPFFEDTWEVLRDT